jgi:hypothetical protein
MNGVGMKTRHLATAGTLLVLAVAGGCLLGNVLDPEAVVDATRESLNRPPTVTITSPQDGAARNVRLFSELVFNLVDEMPDRATITVTVGDSTFTPADNFESYGLRRSTYFVPAAFGALPGTDIGIVVRVIDEFGLVGADSISLMMDSGTGAAPTLLTPDGTTFLSRDRVSLEVEDYWPEFTTNIRYEIQIATETTFAVPQVFTYYTGDGVTVAVGGTPADGTYHWRARAFAYSQPTMLPWASPWSDPSSYVVHDGILSSPALADFSSLLQLVSCADGDVLAVGLGGSQMLIARCDDRVEQRRWIRDYPEYQGLYADIAMLGNGDFLLVADSHHADVDLLALDADGETSLNNHLTGVSHTQSARIGANHELWMAFEFGFDLVRASSTGARLAVLDMPGTSRINQFEPTDDGTNGIYLGAISGQDVSIGKLDPDLATIWSHSISFLGDATGMCLCVLDDGRCVAAYRETYGYSDTDVTHVRMYGAGGGESWHIVLQEDDPGIGNFIPGAIGFSAGNDLFLAGRDDGTSILFAKIADNGTILAVKRFDTCRTDQHGPEVHSLLVQDDHILIAGEVISNQEAWFLRLTHDGNLVPD